MKRLFLPILALMLTAACGGDDNGGPSLTPTTSAPYSQTDLVVGTGAVAGNGSFVTVAYTGWLHDSSRPEAKGRQFDTGIYPFRLGTGAVIRGGITRLRRFVALCPYRVDLSLPAGATRYSLAN